MSEIIRTIDGDTFKKKTDTNDEQSIRLQGTQTPESVHSDASRNTPRGKESSELAKSVLGDNSPEGIQNVKTTNEEGLDHYGRRVASVSKTINGVDIDMGLVQMAQGYSAYNVKYGVNKDPALHNAYKEWYAKNSPYQHGEFRQNMTKENYESMDSAMQAFNDTLTKFNKKEVGQDVLDQATFNAFSDPKKLAHYHYTKAGWNETLTPQTATNSDKDMIQFMLQDPEMAEQYNRAVRNGHLGMQKYPEREKTFWENTKLSFAQFNSVAQKADSNALDFARTNRTEYDMPKEQITKGVSPQYHSKLMLEAAEYGGASALVMRDQLIEDVENNAAFDDLPFYAQFGYGALAILPDPLTVLPAAPIAKLVQLANKATKMYQISKGTEGSRLWIQSGAFTNTSKLLALGTAGAVEAGIQGLPRLSGDHTFTPKDLAMDMAIGGVFGVGIGSIIGGVQYSNAKYKANQKLIREIDDNAANPDAPKHNSEENHTRQEEATNAGNSQTTVTDWTTESTPAPKVVASTLPNAPITGKSVSEMKFTPWAAISEVSTSGFQAAGRKIRNIFPKDSPMNILINKQVGYNNKAGLETVKSQKALTKELREVEAELEAGKLDKSESKEMITDIKRELLEIDSAVKLSKEINSEILHLASVYPDGKVPADVMQTIKGVMYTQKDVRQVNVMDQVLQGKTTDPTQLLGDYVETLKKLPEFEGTVPAPKKELDFIHEFEDIINMERKVDKDDLFTLTQGISKEVSWIKDMVEMNKLARKSKDVAFKEQVEQLNGIVAARLKQADDGDFGGHRAGTADIAAPSILKQRTKPFGKKKLTGTEIIAIMKKEGFTSERGVPTSAAYKKRFAELRKENVAVSREVQGVGDLNKTTSDVHTQGVREGETHYSLDDKQAELAKLEKTPDLDFEGRQALGKLRAELDPKSPQLMTGKKTETEVDAEDILPRDLNQIDSVNAYNTPTKANLEKLRNKLRSINKKNGSTKVSGKKESLQQRKRLAAITKRVKANKTVTVQRMLDNGNMADLVDVIRVSHQIAAEQDLINRAVPPRPKAKSDITDITAEIDADIARWDAAVKNAKIRLEAATKSSDSKLIRTETDNLNRLEAILAKSKEEIVGTKNTKGPDMSKPVTEEEMDIMYSSDADKHLTPDEQIDIQTRVTAAVDKAVKVKADKVADGLAEFARSGEKKRFELANKPTGATDYIGRAITRMTKSVGAIFIDSNLTSMKYFGAKVTEVSRGFGGNAKRAPTAAIIRDATLKESVVKVIPQYRKSIDAYAESKGAGAYAKLKARERSGESDPIVNQFNRDVFLVQEYRRQGKPIPKTIDKSVTDFADQWDYYMDHNHNTLVDANVAGFSAARKVKHYIPHIWQTGKFKGAITKHGRAKVHATLAKAYRNLESDTNPITQVDAEIRADKLINDVLDDTYNGKDQYSPALDSRSKARTDLDTTTELDGLSVLDLLDSDVVGVAAKYSNRVAGWTGLAKATDGMITSQADIDIFKANMVAEAEANNINPKKYVTMFEDTIEQLFGRPTSNMLLKDNGLTAELRMMKDLAALTKMGGLGTAQLAETGQIITRNVMNVFSDEKMAKKVLSMGRGSKSDSLLLEEIQSISNITDDLEFLDRQSTHLDQSTLDEVGKVREMSLKIADLATGGEMKAEASRGLGKLSGYNMIRRAQTRAVQASFMLDIANHFTKGKGVMGNARMADVGLTDTLGKNAQMEAAFKKYAEFDSDGVLQKLNINKWDKGVREELQYAMIRDEAQQIQRTHVGELPPWMNKPIMGLIFQFRQMPIVANSKSLGRSLAFADKEAVTGVMLNTAIAGLVRYGKFAALGAAANLVTGDDRKVTPTSELTQTQKYITPFGIFPDMYDLAFGRNGIDSISDMDSGWTALQSQIPVLGLMNDYHEAGKSATRGDVKGMVDSASNLVPLSNTALAEVMGQALMKQVGKLPSVPEDKTPKQKVKVQPSVAPTKKAIEPTSKPKKRRVDSEIENDFKEVLKLEENARKVGFSNGLWKPHKSVEGGADTIGYGHKLQKGEDFSKGITEKEALELFESDLKAARKTAAKVNGFETFDKKYQLILTEVAFNLGPKKGGKDSWPSLIKAIRVKDDVEVRKQMMRTFTNTKGEKLPLTKRVKAIADVLLGK